KLTYRVLRSFRVAKVFCENSDKINRFDFSPNGETVTSSSADDSIVLYDCQEGKPKRTLFSKKYVVYSHTIDDTIGYFSLLDNKYIRYFPGHSQRVVALSMSPADDALISGSLAKTIGLWDLWAPNCQGLMHLQGKSVCSSDPEGLIFAAGVSSEMVKLYDLCFFDKGPFATFKMQYDRTCEWTGLQQRCIQRRGDAHIGGCHTAGFIYSRLSNGERGIKVAVLDGKHTGPITCWQFNPKFMTFASSCSNMAFWLPTIDD
uniref:Uncharacterized protein n=1 Tax=Cebus imitator TaxID=2715852 RepID=A0A2K5Q470_CEBIM